MSEDSRRFRLVRTTDVTGVSGTGHVADGVAFPDGTVALRWRSEWPTSVVFHDRGVEAVQAIHGHGGATKIEWLDMTQPWESGPDWADLWTELAGYVEAAVANPKPDDAAAVQRFMSELKARRTAPVKAWMADLRADKPDGAA